MYRVIRHSGRLCQHINRRYCTLPVDEEMELNKVVAKLSRFAPPSLAAKWDNTGLLVEPSYPHVVETVLLTNDLTEPVLSEAIKNSVNMVISYHPPIFVPMKRVTQKSWKERIVAKCFENRIAVYSPHTSCDALAGGVNDWLISPFGGTTEIIEPAFSPMFPTPGPSRLEFTVPTDLTSEESTLVEKVLAMTDVTQMATFSLESSTRYSFNCTIKSLPKAIDFLNQVESVKQTIEVIQLTKPPIPNHGQGRLCKMKERVSAAEAVHIVKEHLNLPHVRLAMAVGIDKTDVNIQKVAVCAGSGASVLSGVRADLFITGEMSHHEVLDAVHKGTSVILCDHSNTERGYLSVMAEQLTQVCDNRIKFIVSDEDSDPLQVV